MFLEETKTRQQEIHEKGFDFGRLKVSNKFLDDVSYTLDAYKRQERTYYTKDKIIKALMDKDVETLREISNYFYRTNGIYFRICNYYAEMYRYDWYVVPEIYDKTNLNTNKIDKEFRKALRFLDNSEIKKVCTDIGLQVIRNGAYYACLIPSTNGILFQDLPVRYCRSRYKVAGQPVVELNMRFFDENFIDPQYRLKVLETFPKDIQRGYVLYKSGKLQSTNFEDGFGWYPLEPGSAIKFDFGNGEIPLFASAIPALLDLEAAQELDRRKQMQKLLKILIQKLPLDKNGDLIFDLDEAQDIHRNAVTMLSNAIGVDVLTTFADVESIDISDKNTATSTDDLERVERSLFNAFGTTQNIFNASGNIATTNSILNDESICRNLLLQLETFFDSVAQLMTSSKKWSFRFYMLGTTQYNYKELSKMYKEQCQIGFSKMLPQIALGQSQSFILNSCYFENEILELYKIMIPPLMSTTMNSDIILNGKDSAEVGRKEKPDDQKSDKTLLNRESLGKESGENAGN